MIAGGARGALLVAGTSSDAGVSTVVSGLCRWLHRQGVRVAPFKAQSMSDNAAVTLDGGEIGRAQALQAAACGLEPSVRFNPVLLKPGSDDTSQAVLLGRPVGRTGAPDRQRLRDELADAAYGTFAGLRTEYDVVVCEGADSPAEINLRAGDLANMGLARAANLPTLLVGDVDKGRVPATLYGTLALLPPADQALVCGFVVNRFRGERSVLQPGLDMLTATTGRPVYGVLPHLADPWLDIQDSLRHPDGRLLGRPAPPRGSQPLRVAAIRLPHISGATDLEALAAEPGVRVRLTTSAADVADADLVVLPGTRATVADLGWLRDRGLADAIVAHAAAGRPVLGIGGGYQMLAATIDDRVDSGHGAVTGLGLLPVAVSFAPDKTLARPSGTGFGAPISGYEMHYGTATVRPGAEPFLSLAGGRTEGCRAGPVFGTHWHGAFEHDEFRRRFLTEAAGLAGRTGFVVAAGTDFRRLRERSLDALADAIAEHLDTAAVLELVTHGPPRRLPTIPAGQPASVPDAGGALQSLTTILEGPDDLLDQSTSPPSARPPEPAVDGRRHVQTFAALAERILAAPAYLGPARLVAVDGRAGSGKTTFAARLATALADRGVTAAMLHTDDVLQGWHDMVTFWPRLEEWVLAPLRRNLPAGFRRYDWHAGRFAAARQPLGTPDVLLIEGVTAARAAVRAELTLSVYVQTGRQRRFDRGIQRDGPGVLPHWIRWMQDEDAHFAADRTVDEVDIVADGEPTLPHDPATEFVRIVPWRRACPGDP